MTTIIPGKSELKAILKITSRTLCRCSATCAACCATMARFGSMWATLTLETAARGGVGRMLEWPIRGN